MMGGDLMGISPKDPKSRQKVDRGTQGFFYPIIQQ